MPLDYERHSSGFPGYRQAGRPAPARGAGRYTCVLWPKKTSAASISVSESEGDTHTLRFFAHGHHPGIEQNGLKLPFEPFREDTHQVPVHPGNRPAVISTTVTCAPSAA